MILNGVVDSRDIAVL